MSLPMVWWAIAWFENLDALNELRAKEADNAQIDARYENPDQLAWEMNDVNTRLYWGAFIPPEERGQNTWLNDTGREEINPDDYLEAQFSALESGENQIEATPKIPESTWEFWPLFLRFAEQGRIQSSEAITELLSRNINTENYQTTINAIDWLLPEEKTSLIQAIWYLVEDNTQNASQVLQEQFWNVFSNYEAEWSNHTEIQWSNSASADAYNELCKHFIAQWDNNVELQAQLELWFEMSANAILSRVEVTMWNEVSVETALHNACHNPDFQQRFEALVTLVSETNTQSWAVWGRSRQTLEMTQARQVISQAWLTERFQSAINSLREAQIANIETQAIQAEAELRAIAETAWVQPWDLLALAGWEIDTWPDTQVENPQEA